MVYLSTAGPSRGWSRRLATPGPVTFVGPAVGQKFIKYARMYHFEKKNSKIFFPEGPHESVCGPCKNVSPGPTVALDGPGPQPDTHPNSN